MIPTQKEVNRYIESLPEEEKDSYEIRKRFGTSGELSAMFYEMYLEEKKDV